MHTAASLPQRYTVLDSFRGLCALLVVVFHLHLWQGFSEWALFRASGLLVEFFFTLSGFVLAWRYRDADFSLRDFRQFMLARTFRIVPLHLATLAAMLLLLVLRFGVAGDSLDDSLAWLTPAAGEQLAWQLLLLQAWWPGANPFAFNGPAWSISVEFYLYVAFGLLLLLAGRRQRLWLLLTALACALAVLVQAPFTGSGAFRGLNCFVLGALAQHAYQHWRARPSRPFPRSGMILGNALEVLALALVTAVLLLSLPAKSYLATWVFVAAILVFAAERGRLSRWLGKAGFVQLGHWSFSIYLTHYPVLQAVKLLLQALAALGGPNWLFYDPASQLLYFRSGSAAGDSLLGLLILAAVLAVSRLSHRWIEQTGMLAGRQLNARLDGPQQRVTGLALADAARKG